MTPSSACEAAVMLPSRSNAQCRRARQRCGRSHYHRETHAAMAGKRQALDSRQCSGLPSRLSVALGVSTFMASPSDRPVLNSTLRDGRLELVAAGTWTADHVETLERHVDAAGANLAKAQSVTIDIRNIVELDTLGAW